MANFVLMLKKVPKFIRNKYSITFLVFLVWLLFFDNNDIITQIGNVQQLNELKAEKVRYQGEIEKTRQALYELTSNPEALEKFAREKYLMKKDNEEVFVIVEED